MLRYVVLQTMVPALALACSAAESRESTQEATGGTGVGATGSTVTAQTGSGGGAATSVGGASVSTGTSSGGGSAEEVLVAFLGDSENGSGFNQVLDLVIAEKADAVLHNGDFDYSNDPDGFFATVDLKLGTAFPYFVSVGNHDASAWNEYSAYALEHLSKVGVTLDDPEILDQKFAFVWRGLHFVMVGENGNNGEFADFINAQLDPNEDAWKICGWHKLQEAMQIGDKPDEMSWDIYENCRMNGALITTGHEHSYERTKTLISMTDQMVDPTCPASSTVCVSPGRTFAVVSGLGGHEVRDQGRCFPSTPPYGCNGEWASIYTSDQDATYGAFFVLFNAGGDPKRAHAYFKNIDGAIIDEFDIVREP
jgi:hypothetical protein